MEQEVLAMIRVALGGRVAEEIVFGEISTGAESDIEQLTGLARLAYAAAGVSRAQTVPAGELAQAARSTT